MQFLTVRSFNYVCNYLYRTHNVCGSVKVNGGPRDMERFRRQSCYILQDSELQPLLRVKEAMMFASHLKLGATFTHKVKEERVCKLKKLFKLLCHVFVLICKF